MPKEAIGKADGTLMDNSWTLWLTLAGFMLLGLVGWFGQWGQREKVVRILVLIVIGLSGAGMLALGGVTLVLAEVLKTTDLSDIQVNALVLFACLGGWAIPTLIPPFRRLLGKTVFRGLDADNPAHTWALFIYGDALIGGIGLLYILFNPKTFDPQLILSSFQGTDLAQMAVLNALCFVVMALLGSGIFIRYSWRETLQRLGLTKLPWKTAGTLFLFSLALSFCMQFILEAAMMPFISPVMQHYLEQLSKAMSLTGPGGKTLVTATLVGAGAGVGEEVLFRGLVQPVFGIIPTALLFALIHTHYGPTLLLVELFIVGATFGYIRQRYNTTAAIIVHAGFDFFAILTPLLHH